MTDIDVFVSEAGSLVWLQHWPLKNWAARCSVWTQRPPTVTSGQGSGLTDHGLFAALTAFLGQAWAVGRTCARGHAP